MLDFLFAKIQKSPFKIDDYLYDKMILFADIALYTNFFIVTLYALFIWIKLLSLSPLNFINYISFMENSIIKF